MAESVGGVLRRVFTVLALVGAADARAQEAADAAPPSPAPPAAAKTPAVAVRVGGLAQVDGHLFIDDYAGRVADEILVRRARVDVGATLGRFSARLAPEFGQGRAQLLDGYAEARLPLSFALRAGKFIPPLSSERLQPTPAYFFIETALSSNLAPSRDVGVQLSGGIGKVAIFAIGLFDGAPDGGSVDGDASDEKEGAGRIFVKPFAPLGDGWLANLGVGVSGSVGSTRGDPAKATELPTYRSDGLATIFEYTKASTGPSAANTAWSAGRRMRVGLQASWYVGPAAIVGEYLISEQRVLIGATPQAVRVRNRGWQGLALWNVTGEKATEGVVVPAAPVDGGGWGALTVAVRASSLDLDDQAFALVAAPERSVSAATSLGAGVSWWPVAGARVVLDYVQTFFEGGAGTSAAVADRPDERALLLRAQLCF